MSETCCNSASRSGSIHRRRSFLASALLSGLLACCTALAFEGRVVSVHDGDTLTVLVKQSVPPEGCGEFGNCPYVAQQQIKVRLASIDAPELSQPFGTRSRQSLAEICHGKQATVTPTARDRYGRTVGEVDCDGAPASPEQVRRGMAWVYVKYAPKGSLLYQLEADARAARLGLWADPAPTPPWEWRHPPK